LFPAARAAFVVDWHCKLHTGETNRESARMPFFYRYGRMY
jgi:hypothetical protein